MHVLVDFLLLLVKIFFCYVEAIIRLIIPRSEKDVKGKIVLVTGGGNGIGKEISLEFARHGAILVLWDIDEKGNKETVEEIKALGGTAHCYKCDVSSTADIRSVASRTRQDVGHVDILVNNAGVANGKEITELSERDIRRLININLFAHFWTVQEFLPEMKNKNYGHIVTVASAAGFTAAPLLTDYCASKHGNVGFSEALCQELRYFGKSGVKVTTVAPGYVATKMVQEKEDRITSTNRFKLNLLDPTDVAKKIVAGTLRNERVIIIPKSFYIFPLLHTIMPTRANDLVAAFIRPPAGKDKEE